MSVSAQQLAGAVSELVRIPSVNPLHHGPKAGVSGEAAVAGAVAERLQRVGATEVVLDEIAPGRPNVYGFIAGHTDRLVVLDVHTDTVTVEHMTEDPFDGRIEHGQVWGRGALDTKASLGVMLTLLADWRARALRPTPTLLVVGSAGEEAGGLPGAQRFREWGESRGLDIAQMIVAEPTMLAPIHGHKGGLLARITVHGRAAHSALPHLGENAIDAMAAVIIAIREEHERLQTLAPTTPLGNGTVTTATIEGGTGGNIVPDRCSIVIGRRIAPGEDPTVEFHRLSDLARAASPLPVDVESLNPAEPDGSVGLPSFYLPEETPLVQQFVGWSGNPGRVAPFGTNALRYSGFAKEIAVFGPGSIDDAHQATECVAIDDLVRLAAIYERWLEPR